MGALETLQAKFECQLLFVESGGDNLAANYSRELADYIIYVIDVSVRISFRNLCESHWIDEWQGGDKIPRKGGPGISQSDLLVINKVSKIFVPKAAMGGLIRCVDRPGSLRRCISGDYGQRL